MVCIQGVVCIWLFIVTSWRLLRRRLLAMTVFTVLMLCVETSLGRSASMIWTPGANVHVKKNPYKK